MKNKSYIGISLIILIFGIIFIPRIVDRIKNGSVVQNDRMSLSHEIIKEPSLVKIGPAPKFELTDQNNVKISNKEYVGKVYVLEFFFSTCPSICPVMNKNMVEIQNEFSKNGNFGIASITINPENDTAAVLKKHATEIGATSSNWHFLTGDKAYILGLANKGFNLFAAENGKVNGGFEHSGLFALIDKQGNIRCRKDKQGNPILYYDGLEQSGVKAIKEDIKLLLEE
ncbi:SCO family protein [Flavobacterium sp.]|uniref:SCO family protein n=1 Tax=Flavobacterium sp. TaxID=239 RepID=UPI003750008E